MQERNRGEMIGGITGSLSIGSLRAKRSSARGVASRFAENTHVRLNISRRTTHTYTCTRATILARRYGRKEVYRRKRSSKVAAQPSLRNEVYLLLSRALPKRGRGILLKSVPRRDEFDLGESATPWMSTTIYGLVAFQACSLAAAAGTSRSPGR